MQSKTLYRRSNGRALSISDDNRLGSGGEGAIYTLDELPDLVAKVYHSPSRSIGAKLTLMVDEPPTMPEGDGHVSIAWPLDTLHTGFPATTGNTAGFLMRRMSSMQPVNSAYNPAARKRNFPHFTYKHLCAVAINIAIAVNAVHGRNYVIGDINESNIMVNDNGLVTLIDTDSFQVIDRFRKMVYRSPVGKPEYTPGELQGHSFDAVDRDQYHDRFGLGVLIFQLLMEGRHPYTGRYTGRGEPPAIEDNISKGHFLHSERRSVPLVEGPGFVPWDTLSESIRDLFGLCLETGHGSRTVRPPASEWKEEITKAVGLLEKCVRNSNHLYFRNNPSCPWCERKKGLGGRDSFPEIHGPEPFSDEMDGSYERPGRRSKRASSERPAGTTTSRPAGITTSRPAGTTTSRPAGITTSIGALYHRHEVREVSGGSIIGALNLLYLFCREHGVGRFRACATARRSRRRHPRADPGAGGRHRGRRHRDDR